MKNLRMAALALALGASGTAMAATDGALGDTSTGTFSASITITPDTSNYVQIVGLSDHIIAPISIQKTSDTQSIDPFCMLRNTAGSLTITVSQDGNTGIFNMVDQSNSNVILPQLALFNQGTGGELLNGVPKVTFNSAADCLTTNETTQHTSLFFTIPAPNGDPTKVGNFSGTFSVLLASQ